MLLKSKNDTAELKHQKLMDSAGKGKKAAIIDTVKAGEAEYQAKKYASARSLMLSAVNGFYQYVSMNGDDPDGKMRSAIRSAFVTLANIYNKGLGTERDTEKALLFTEKAAEFGDADKAFEIAEKYRKENPDDPDGAIARYERANGNGHPEAGSILGKLYYEQKEYQKAFEHLNTSSERGDTEAKLELAEMYSNGLGVSKAPYRAIALYRKCVDSGDRRAVLKLGKLLLQCSEYEEAKKYLKQAADNGQTDARRCLVELYQKSCDHEELWKLINARSADVDNSEQEYLLDAAYELNRHYEMTGQHIERQLQLLDIAAEAGYGNSEYLLASKLYNGDDPQRHYPKISKLFESYLSKYSMSPYDSGIRSALAEIYYNGSKELPPDYAKALKYLMSLACSDANAAYTAGMICFRGGNGADKNYRSALELFEMAYKNGSDDMQGKSALMIAKLFQTGDDTVPAMADEAVKWYKLAVLHGSREAAAVLGSSYFKGTMTEQSYQKAIYYYEHSDDDSTDRALCTAYCKFHAVGQSRQTEAAAVILKDIDEKDLDTESLLILMYYSSDKKDYISAGRYALTLIGRGLELDKKLSLALAECADQLVGRADLDSVILRGDCCYQLADTDKSAKDRLFGAAYYCLKQRKAAEKVVLWFTKLTELGGADACTNLGWCYSHGFGTKQDKEKAFEYYTKAANGGDEVSMHNLGDVYMGGRGCSKDYEKAFEWLSKSAEHNYSDAFGKLFKLGRLCETENNEELAVRVYEKLSGLGSEESKEKAKKELRRLENTKLCKNYLESFKALTEWERKAELYYTEKDRLKRLLDEYPDEELKKMVKPLQLDDMLSQFGREILECFEIDEERGEYAAKTFFDPTENDKYTESVRAAFGNDGEEIYKMSLELENNGRQLSAIIGYYCAAKMDSRNALDTLSNMGRVRSDYFIGRE